MTMPARRQLATIVFCDVVGSTTLGEVADAEVVRELMFQYFHRMRAVIERHGGTVEKFIGDAVEAVFGLPSVHEDDPLRALRSAWEMAELMPDLNTEFERRFGTRIALRIGVNSGEVVTGGSERETIVTGDVVNVAARLQAAAAPGEILVGEETRALARDAIRVEPLEPLALKGKRLPVQAYRLLAVTPDVRARSVNAGGPFVGRGGELALLEERWQHAASGRGGGIVVVGDAGIGKSRLVSELAARAAGTVLSGGCPSYGAGMTYGSLAHVTRRAAGIRHEDSAEQSRRKLGRLVVDDAQRELVARRLAQALGLEGGGAPAEEIGWAFRRMVALVAARRPLLLVLDDLHWGEEPLLDLVERLAADAAEQPLLVVGLARPELLHARPAWAESALRLQPLAAAEAEQLVAATAGSSELGHATIARLAVAAQGNPLFIEELVALMRQDPAAELPRSLELLLTARLDRLSAAERDALERGAVEGQRFHRGAVVELSEPQLRDGVADVLAGLCGSELLRPEAAAFAGEAAYGFRHVLIREAAYRSSLKSLRAELHARYADWLLQRIADRTAEYDELLGYHLEQAFRYRGELGPSDAYRHLAQRASRHLGDAGLRALARGDVSAAVALLDRSLQLFPPDASPAELLLAFGEACWARFDAARAVPPLEQAAATAFASGRPELEGTARIALATIGTHMTRAHGDEELLATLEAWLPRLEQIGDERALAKAYLAGGLEEAVSLRTEAAMAMLERALRSARRAGSAVDELEAAMWLSMSVAKGPIPVAEAIARLQQHAEQASTLAARATVLERIALLHAYAGRLADARALLDASARTYDELGLDYQQGVLSALTEPELAELTEDLGTAERLYRDGCARLEAIRETGALSTLEARLANVLCDRGHVPEAEALAEHALAIADPRDLITGVAANAARARALAARGELLAAETCAQAAVELANRGDAIKERGLALSALADVLAAAGRTRDAARTESEAFRLYERKGILALQKRASVRLESLHALSHR
jgi:class 3 adenylate cyclase/tetratricopeptide (TPR) repeat protein